MPTGTSTAKRGRQTKIRGLRNRRVVTQLRTMQKKVRTTEKPDANEIRSLISAIDKAAKRGIIHRNAANRRKARLNKRLAAAK